MLARFLWISLDPCQGYHGEDAALEAAQRADAMLEKGAIDGRRVWKRVLAAVKEIQRQEPKGGEAVH